MSNVTVNNGKVANENTLQLISKVLKFCFAFWNHTTEKLHLASSIPIRCKRFRLPLDQK